MRAITTLIVMFAMLSIGLLLAVAVLDPLRALVLTYDLGGMNSQVNGIHVVLVKYMAPASMVTIITWAVLRILRDERQQV